VFAIIAGTGFPASAAERATFATVPTRYGEAVLGRAALGGREVVLLLRHGPRANIPPHQINYRANIAALDAAGVRRVLATASVGAINPEMPPGTLAVLTQFIDCTHGRSDTYFDGSDGMPLHHPDMTDPYCPTLRGVLIRAADRLGLDTDLHPAATYACTQGPRFETPAEVLMLQRAGADVVGMTNVPEVVLAREAGMCYAAVAVLANWAAGLGESHLSHHVIRTATERNAEQVHQLFTAVVAQGESPCDCPGPGWVNPFAPPP